MTHYNYINKKKSVKDFKEVKRVMGVRDGLIEDQQLDDFVLLG